MIPKRLLAKSFTGDLIPDQALLIEHSSLVAQACSKLAEILGSQILNNMEISNDYEETLHQVLKCFGWTHDLGKCSNSFQDMLQRKKGTNHHMVRHEILSFLLMHLEPNLRKGIEAFPHDTQMILFCTVLGHHLKTSSKNNSFSPQQTSSVTIYTSHPDWNNLIERMWGDLPHQPLEPIKFTDDNITITAYREPGKIDARDELAKLLKKLKRHSLNEELNKLLSATKALAVCGDVLASALGSDNEKASFSVKQYIDEHLLNTGLVQEDLDEIVQTWCRKYLKSDSFELRPFQIEVANSNHSLTLVEAGCGTGKSLAAYLWAKQWCKPIPKRLFFCLPTTGTATEQYADYALLAEVKSDLIHSRASIDLEQLRSLDLIDLSDDEDDPFKTQQDIVESLRLWSTPLVVCTMDTVLGLMVNNRRSIYSYPSFMNGMFVFDEIHSLDSRMFGHLVMFLRTFPNIPVLLMTASLQESRKEVLQQVRQDIKIIQGPTDLEEYPRYAIQFSPTKDEVENEIKKVLSEKGKALWVCNQVDWAIERYRSYKEIIAGNVVDLYHSRFKYKDRSKIHRRVIDDFKNQEIPRMLIATQVAEMSLDLSADLLITDLASISSLIQRFGRSNRKIDPNEMRPPKQILVLPIDGKNSYPYSKDDLHRAEQWINHLVELNRPISQRDLKEAAKLYGENGSISLVEAEFNAGFITGEWETVRERVRVMGYTVPIIMKEDVDQYIQNFGVKPNKDWVREFEIPMPTQSEINRWSRLYHTLVAPLNTIRYDFDPTLGKGEGAVWRQKSFTN
ncbi:MAG TPA: CRISPR-associated helicase Cas3' [Bacillota bacterium]|nr:CRISPR-associated helicase Cas3' [Bacillota bacterium]